MSEFFPEYQDEHSGRAYPFDENARRVNEQGITIPNALLVDMLVQVPGAQGRLYLRSIDMTTQEVEFGDTQTRRTVAVCLLPTEPGTVPVNDTTIYRRVLGQAVFGAGLSDLAIVGGSATWKPAETPIVPAAALPLPGEGVRGLDVGGELVTGAVNMAGGDGIHVYSFIDSKGASRIRVDARGGTLSREDCSNDDCASELRCIRIKVEAGSPVTVTRLEANRAVINTVGFDATDLCPHDPLTEPLPSESTDLICDPEEEEPAEPYTGAPAKEIDICASGGQLLIEAVSVPGYVNPLEIRVGLEPASPVPEFPDGDDGLRAFERKRRSFQDAISAERGHVKLGYRV